MVTTSYWSYPSNFSNGTAVTDLGSLMQYLQYATGNLFGWIFLLAIGLIMFLTLKSSGNPTSKSLTASMFGLTLLSVLFMMIGLITFKLVMILVIILIILILIARSESNIGL